MTGHDRADLLRDAAAAIIASGYAVTVTTKRRHIRRVEQVAELARDTRLNCAPRSSGNAALIEDTMRQYRVNRDNARTMIWRARKMREDGASCKKIKIMVAYGNGKHKRIEIDADVFGPLAVHQTPFRSGWTITHVKTGYAITGDLSNKRGAYALVKAAAKRPELFEHLSTKDREKNKQAALYFRTCREKIKSARWGNL